MAVGAFAISFNAFAAKHLPLFEGLILIMFLIGFFVIIIPLWVLAPRASVSDVFGKFENWGGWASMGGACIVGQMAASAAFIVRFLRYALAVVSLTIATGRRQRRPHGRGSQECFARCPAHDDADRLPERRPRLHHDRHFLLRHPIRRRASHHVDRTLSLRRYLRDRNWQHGRRNRHDRPHGLDDPQHVHQLDRGRIPSSLVFRSR